MVVGAALLLCVDSAFCRGFLGLDEGLDVFGLSGSDLSLEDDGFLDSIKISTG